MTAVCHVHRPQLPALPFALALALADLGPVSPYSWFAHTNLTRTRPLLAAHGVDVEIVPFFLGGARNGAGNPFTVPAPAKATWGNNDAARVAHLLGLPLQRPTKFPILSLYVRRLGPSPLYIYPTMASQPAR